MFDFLPAVNPTLLSPAPLAQVIAQVKFNAQSSLSAQQGVGVLYDLISDRYPRLLSEQQAVITASPTGVSTGQVPQWRMTDLAGKFAVIVGAEQLAIETTAYTNWSDLRERLEQALSALNDVAAPKVRERIGLRYVNHIPVDDDGSFAGGLVPELRGLADKEGWRDVTSAALSQMLLLDGDAQMTLRYGTGPQVIESDHFVLDIDCSNNSPVAFDTAATLEYFDALNDVAYRCFCACITEKLRVGR